MAKIFVNGQAYDSVEAMPPDVRATYQQIFADANQNGVPDMFEGGAGLNVQTLNVDGRSSAARNVSPEEAQRIAAQVMSAFGVDATKNSNDLFGSSEFDREQPAQESWFRSDNQVPAAPQWDSPKSTSGFGIKKWMLLMVVFDMIVLGGVLAWYFLMR
jgi:hypothetical protein